MTPGISKDHPLRQLFAALAEKSLSDRLGWCDLPIISYMANLLVDFTYMENLFKIHNTLGRRLEDVGEMLLEADVMLQAGSFEREREVHRHIGDFTLFMVGIFPEYLNRIKSRLLVHHSDFLIDYVKVGKRSYHNVSEFDYGPFKESVLLFKKLADNFELCVVSLGFVRNDLEQMRNNAFLEARRRLLN
jgi:hypothetical protein